MVSMIHCSSNIAKVVRNSILTWNIKFSFRCFRVYFYEHFRGHVLFMQSACSQFGSWDPWRSFFQQQELITNPLSDNTAVYDLNLKASWGFPTIYIQISCQKRDIIQSQWFTRFLLSCIPQRPQNIIVCLRPVPKVLHHTTPHPSGITQHNVIWSPYELRFHFLATTQLSLTQAAKFQCYNMKPWQ